MSFGPQLLPEAEARALISPDMPIVRLTVQDAILSTLYLMGLAPLLLSIFLLPYRFSSFWPLNIHPPQDKADFYTLILLLFVPTLVVKLVFVFWRRFRQVSIVLRGGPHWFMALGREHLLLNINPVLYLMPEQQGQTCIDIKVSDIKALYRKCFVFYVGKTSVKIRYALVTLNVLPSHELIRFVEETNAQLISMVKHHHGAPYLFLQGCNLFVLWPDAVYPSIRVAFQLFGKIIPQNPAEPYIISAFPGASA